MKPASWLSFLLIPVFILAGCAPERQTVQPTQMVHLPSSTNLPVVNTVAPTSTPTLAITVTPSPTATRTPQSTLKPESVEATMQPLLQDPLNCAAPCFLGITPGKTSVDTVRAFFDPLGFQHKEGKDQYSGRDFYSVAYESSIGRDSGAIFYLSNNLVENIEITPEITRQENGSPRLWIAYSPETLIKKYGTPSRVEVALGLGQINTTIVMIMYFDEIGLIALYSGYDSIPGHPNSPQLCPFTFPFDHVRLWMGTNPPHPPTMPSLPLKKVTSLTVDQFTQLMLGEPENACFVINGDEFK